MHLTNICFWTFPPYNKYSKCNKYIRDGISNASAKIDNVISYIYKT